jgi:hypothetical protein
MPITKRLYTPGRFDLEGLEPVEHWVKCVGGFTEAGVDHVTTRPIGDH